MERFGIGLSIVALIILMTFIVRADKGVIVAPKASKQVEEKWAIIIGIDDYEDIGIGKLKYATKDADGLYQTLTSISSGFKSDNVVLMTKDANNKAHIPTRNNIIAMLSSWLSLPDEDDTVLFYFSGHGIEKKNISYVLPQDSKMANLPLTAIEVEYIKSQLRECKAQKRILILDSCHSGAGKDPITMGKATASAIEEASGMVTLASCNLEESSYEMDDKSHGAFTYYLIEAIKGNADRDKDGQLWASEVNYYVWDNVRKWAAKNGLKQNPKYVAAVQGEIILAQVTPSGTEPAPPSIPPPVIPPPPPSLPQTKISLIDGSEMVLIPAGEFLMGSPKGEGSDDEHPQHTVYLDAFYIDKYEVTNARYKKFVDATAHRVPYYDADWAKPYNWQNGTYPTGKGSHPVVLVSWDDANAYCKWAGKRLPTEAEWEKAARGGLEGKKYPWGDEDPKGRANYASSGTEAVGSYAANGYGLYDMAGNVWEWCADWYDENYYKTSSKYNPKGPNSGKYKVLRDGSWVNGVSSIRAAHRYFDTPDNAGYYLGLAFGFRCVSSVP